MSATKGDFGKESREVCATNDSTEAEGQKSSLQVSRLPLGGRLRVLPERRAQPVAVKQLVVGVFWSLDTARRSCARRTYEKSVPVVRAELYSATYSYTQYVWDWRY